MNPHQKNKIDISSLSADEQRLFRLYGKLPNKKDVAQRKLEERKYFDSGDYALSKAGKASSIGVTTIGTEHPQAENIPHLSASSPPSSASSPSSVMSPGLPHLHHREDSSHFLPGASGHRGSIQSMHGNNQSKSPVKESSYLARTASVDEPEGKTRRDNPSGAGAADADEAIMNTATERTNQGMGAQGADRGGEEIAVKEGSVSPPVLRSGVLIPR